ncbi:choice-of-anchor D domain-containing protein [Meiothermus sp. CFH 77666]|uniref:choice-of-anchor D domain-containing protein n=1 Tax=Meiothermus sp. CFH 77666 TaxID=2817942 RepID=UPI001AA011F1|nr:choice-of-anchor D domain-containing protein [Meiothermus sp. CFH 77666]MBO1436168.1 choice-of-anchor D domain-containing protein [Meiothermus sp. CFH 77666]
MAQQKIWLLGVLLLASGCPSQPQTPKLEATPTTLEFGMVAAGSTSSAKIVVLSNTGSVPISGFTGGDPSLSVFGVVVGCTGTLNPGASCTYSYTFAPTATAVYNATATIQTSAGPVNLELKGSGVATFSVSALELDFGEVGIGATSPTQVVTIRNHGSTPLTGFAGGAPFDTQFGATQNCAAGVAPGASCQYNFTFKPTQAGSFETTSNSSTNAGPFVIKLKGKGVGPKLWVTPLELDFGPVLVGNTSPAQSVTIRNVGKSTLGSFAGGAPFDTQFGATQNCAAGVAPGASCQYNFTFKPTQVGSFETTSNSSTNAGPFIIKLKGTGVTSMPTGAARSVSPLELDFGEVGVNVTSPTQVVTIRNPGTATLTSFAGGAPFDTQFGATQNCAAGVAPGASCQYNFTFKPTQVGSFETTSNSSTNAGPFIIKLKGTGVGPRLWVTPLELDFGTVAVGTTSAPLTVTITNLGLSTLTNFAGGAPFNTQFGATQNCAAGVAPGASCQYTFTFKPTTAGVFETTSNSSTNAGPFVIKLRGNTPPGP